MKRTVLIEGILLLVIGLVSAGEGMHLIVDKDPNIIYDMIGPGYYVLLLSIALMATGVVHLIVNYRKRLIMEKVEVTGEMRRRMISIVAVMAIYTFLIGITGYLVATIVFFLLEFRVIGIKSWRLNVILTIVLTAVYYIVFIRYCDMVFPRGILLR
jgi:hypothetical protein